MVVCTIELMELFVISILTDLGGIVQSPIKLMQDLE